MSGMDAETVLTTTRSVRKRLDFERPVPYPLGGEFKRAERIPLDRVVHWETW